MKVSDTRVGKVYYELASKADWGGDSLAHQVVVLEQIKAALARFPGSSSVFDFGMGSNGVRSIQTVSETLDIVDAPFRKTSNTNIGNSFPDSGLVSGFGKLVKTA